MAELYAIIGIGKLKTAGNIKGVLDHMTRARETPNSNGRENITMIEPPALADIMQEINSYLPRKNAVLAFDILLTASPEFFTGKSPEQVKEWAETSLQWACDKFGKHNIKGAILHLDESTPHLQIFSGVVCEETAGKPARLCAREFTGGRQKMRELWTQYAQAVKKYGLKRGREFSPAKHKDIKSYYADVRRGAELATGRKFKADELPAPTMADRLNPAQYAVKLVNHVADFYRKQNGNLKAELEATCRELEQVTTRTATDRKLYQQMKDDLGKIKALQKALTVETMAKATEQAKYKRLIQAIGDFFKRNIAGNSILRHPDTLGALKDFPELQKMIRLSLTPDIKERQGTTMTRGL